MSFAKIILTLAIAAFPILGNAETGKQEKIEIQAKGMVCGFCAQGIEKKFKALPQVEKIKVSLETKKIDVDVKDGGKISDDEIKKILNESGYELVKIERKK